MYGNPKNQTIFLVILREAIPPAIVGLIWSGIEIYNNRGDSKFDIWAGVKVFTSAFVGTSWLLSQILRIVKQRNTDLNFDYIKERTDNLVKNLETKTAELINQITGGGSYPRFLLSPYKDEIKIDVTLDHRGTHALVDLHIELILLQSFEYNHETKTRITGAGRRIHQEYVSALQPKTNMQLCAIEIENTNDRLIMIRSRARNGTTEQIIALRRFPDWKNGWGYQSWIFTALNEIHLNSDVPPGTEAWSTNAKSNVRVSIQPNGVVVL